MKIGCVVIHLKNDIESSFENLVKNGFDNCQLVCWDMDKCYSDIQARKIINAKNKYGIEITTLWAGWSGPCIWNFYEGQKTLGLVPPEFRLQRIEDLIRGIQFADKIGVNSITTHVGFIPENPYDENYAGLIAAVKTVASAAASYNIEFRFESGQETPVTLLRAIEDIGTENLGINLDPANLILYGKANPCDAIDLIGKYVKGVHAKDGRYPINGRQLGKQTPLGKGKVCYPKLLEKLNNIGYDGVLTIEREIEGDQQTADILEGKKYLENILENL